MLARIIVLLIAKSFGQWIIRILIGLGLATVSVEGVKIHPIVGLFLGIFAFLVWIGIIISSIQAIVSLVKYF
jgi:hypothetical protein